MPNRSELGQIGLRASFDQHPPPNWSVWALSLSSILSLAAFPVLAQSSPQAIIDAQAAEIARLRQEIESLKNPKPADAAKSVDPVASPPEATGADATNVLETVTVRTRRVTPLEKVKDTAQSISVVTGEELARFETTRFSDVLKKLGNVRAAGATGLVTGQNLSTRGIGFPGGSTQDPGIGIMVDGVSYAFTDMAGSFNFFDLDTVEVSRGPQGTTGGLASNYGRITFKTRAPSFTDEAEASVTVGQRKTLITKAILGGGVIDNLLAWRGTFYRETGEGPYVNQYDITQSLYNKDRTSGRLQFLLTPTPTLSARLSLEATPKGAESGSSSFGAFSRATPNFYDVYEGGRPIAVDQRLEPDGRLSRRWFKQDHSYSYLDPDGTKDRLERSDAPPPERETKGATVELNWKPGDHQYTSTSAWRDYTFAWHGKNSGIRDVFDIMREPSQAWTFYKQFSQELKVASPIGGKIDYQAGLHYLKTLTLSGKPGWGQRYGSDAGAYYANTAQYDALDTDAAGRYLLLNSVDRLNTAVNSKVEGSKGAVYGNLNWHLNPAATFNFGLRLSRERSQTTQSAGYISHQGYAPELNPVSVNNVQLGGFASTGTGALGTNNAAQLALADTVALKYFGRNKYEDPSDPTGANGLALTPTQKQQVAHAKAIRASLLGAGTGIYGNTPAQAFEDTLVNASFSPSYKLDDDHTAYVSWQHGEKPGVSQIVGATPQGGKSALTKPEKTDAYELGLKSTFFNKSLVLNSSLFVQKIRNYIQSMYYEDEAQKILNGDGRTVYTQGLGNVPRITTKGIELDATYTLRNTTFRAAGAYTEPKYDAFPTSAKPPELRPPDVRPPQTPVRTVNPYQDISGRTLAGASKLTYNLSVDHTIPVWDDKEIHAGLNYNHVSAFNPSSSLSRYAQQNGYGLADLALGLRTRDKKFDVTLIVRNLLDKDYGSYYDWNSYSPSEPRWVGVSISTKLY